MTSTPVRMQSPGWRYLERAETVQLGDEYLVLGQTPSANSKDLQGNIGEWKSVGSLGYVGMFANESDASFGWLRRKVDNLADCSCKKHQIDPKGDVYVQHNNWVTKQLGRAG